MGVNLRNLMVFDNYMTDLYLKNLKHKCKIDEEKIKKAKSMTYILSRGRGNLA